MKRKPHSTTINQVCDGLAAVMVMNLMIQNAGPLTEYLNAVAWLTDERCPRCGYRLDHPFMVHGKPCEAL